MTIGYMFRNEDKEILLGLKAQGRFGEGRWNGPGGKVKVGEGETIYEGFTREVEEESGLIVKKAEKRGFLVFHFIEDPIVHHCHIYEILDYAGQIGDSDEMTWEWFPAKIDRIPLGQMWPADRYWMPYLLAHKKFTGIFFYRDKDILLGYDELKEVKSFD